MPNQESHRDEIEPQETLELKKETLQDLDVDVKDQENVKGGMDALTTVIKTIGAGLTTVARTG